MEPSVTAQPVDTSHLTGVTYSAVQTLVQTSLEGNLIGMAMDGNGRNTSVIGIDPTLSLVGQHAQVLQAHFADQSIRDFLPGYISMGDIIESDPTALRRPRSTTLVWVLS
jgi:hypothetical protein